jgi:hypothetical protein
MQGRKNIFKKLNVFIYVRFSRRTLKDVCGILGFCGVLDENIALRTVDLFAG